ncbi:hypothetical protein F5X98DRAFT_331060 [Xylaria grammica]|nr:hypothetical protein F5X98DRAFT_331060 [Xylaria grammica]
MQTATKNPASLRLWLQRMPHMILRCVNIKIRIVIILRLNWIPPRGSAVYVILPSFPVLSQDTNVVEQGYKYWRTSPQGSNLRIPVRECIVKELSPHQKEGETPMTMPHTAHISSYRLRQDNLEAYLRGAFPGAIIEITAGDDTYDVELPNKLTQDQYDEIDGLRERRNSE